MKSTILWFLGLLVGILFYQSSLHGFGGMDRPAYFVDPCILVGGEPIYYPAPMVATPPNGGPILPPGRVPSPYVREYAVPAPAPASPEKIESLPSKPRVIESRSMQQGNAIVPSYDVYPVNSSDKGQKKPADDTLSSVCFWNLTDRTISLQVNGKPYTLQRSRNLTLTLPRKFLWRAGNQDPVTTEVTSDREGVEIVLRQ